MIKEWMDITEYESYHLSIPTNAPELPGKVVPICKFSGFELSNEWYKIIPELKEVISPWHLVFKDVWFVPFSHNTTTELLKHPNCKGTIRYLDTTLVIIVGDSE